MVRKAIDQYRGRVKSQMTMYHKVRLKNLFKIKLIKFGFNYIQILFLIVFIFVYLIFIHFNKLMYHG